MTTVPGCAPARAPPLLQYMRRMRRMLNPNAHVNTNYTRYTMTNDHTTASPHLHPHTIRATTQAHTQP